MKIFKKAELSFVAGRLIASDNTVVTPYDLAGQVNEIAELVAFVEWANENEAKILASDGAERMVFTIPKPKAPEFKTGLIVATPLLDEQKAEAEALAIEFLDTKVIESIDRHLARYGVLARFMADEHVVVNGDVTERLMLANPLTFTTDDVVKAVEEYHEPRIQKLVGLVSFT